VGCLSAEVGKLMANPATRDRLRAISLELLPPSTPECFAAYIKTEIERWVVILKNSGAGARIAGLCNGSRPPPAGAA